MTATTAGSTRLAEWIRRDARFDLPASLVVFLVAIPLSLGIAVASGAPVAAGLIAAAVGGVVAGLLGGSALQVSGPAAGLTVVVAETVNTFGWRTTCAITVAAGFVQILFGLSKVGRWALAISPTVVHAMLAGIGVSIVLGQLNVAFGAGSQSSAWANLTELVESIGDANHQALIAAGLVVTVLVAWPRLPDRVRVVPGPLAAVALATVVAAIALPSARRVDLGGSVLSQVGLPPLPHGSWFALTGAVLTIAIIASVESLLSAVAVDKLKGDTHTNLDRELFGQGMANSLSGLLGGLPVTGVIVRSATNVSAGARTRASAILHGVWVLVFAALLGGLVEQIPLAALAGLLIVMGVQLVKPVDIITARERGEGWIYAVTIGGVLALNLVEGVMIGLLGTLVMVLWRVLRVRTRAHLSGTSQDGRELWVVDVHGTISFLATPRLVDALGQVPPGQHVEVDLLADYVDPGSREQLNSWRSRYEAAGGTVDIQNAGGHHHDARAGRSDLVTPRVVLPWARWQPGEDGERVTSAERLAMGIREYHRRHTPTLSDVFDGLKDGQSPDAFFLSCVDSRVVPNLITSSGPGDLFTVRTMGNIVPERSSHDASVSAALHYGVDSLQVPSVIVCGHSGCGAMAAALDHASAAGPVGVWLHHADAALRAWRTGHPVGRAAADAGLCAADQLSQVNVAVSLERLRAELGDRETLPAFIGLWFDIASGTLHVLGDEPGAGFTVLTDAELSLLAGR